MKPSDVAVHVVRLSYDDYCYRMPIKFGGSVVEKVTLLNVEISVRSRAGQRAAGFGSMPLGNIWSFPSKVLAYDDTLAVMKRLAERIRGFLSDFSEAAHPIDISHRLEPVYFQAAQALTRELALPQPIPKLCTLVVASAFDAALHDAFGKANRIHCYDGYAREFLHHDLGYYLGPEFAGDWLENYISRRPRPWLPVYHLVGALDPIWDSNISRRIGDGLPEALTEWIVAGRLTHFKIKLNGDDLDWDVNRVLDVGHAIDVTRWQHGIGEPSYSLDFNERCPDVRYLLSFLARVKESAPALFDAIQYVEQPTARDLRAHPANDMHAASAIKPVVIDESLVDYESLLLARELGYTGVALKACKGQSNALLMAAAARKFGMFLCVQDLTCPGASLIHSASLAAHVPGVAAIECNARQYVPAANQPWKEDFGDVIEVRNGRIQTGALDGLGLGIKPAEMIEVSR